MIDNQYNNVLYNVIVCYNTCLSTYHIREKTTLVVNETLLICLFLFYANFYSVSVCFVTIRTHNFGADRH
jgi:hypothetical protein